MWRAVPILSLLLLAGCADTAQDGMVDVAYIGDARADGGTDAEARLVQSARWQGLVRFDPAGQVVPGLAERWIVTDDGLSYIFRIREYEFADGSRLTAKRVRRKLVAAIDGLGKSGLALDLAKMSDIRAMTGRVIEIRLRSPMPGFLQLLAQPELALEFDGDATALMSAADAGGQTVLTALPPQRRGLPAQEDWAERTRPVSLRSTSASEAVAGFANDRFDVILGGRVQDLPLAAGGPLSRGTVRLEPAIGLFGLDVVRPQGFLEDPANREAVAMALDRPALVEPLSLGGWSATSRIVPETLQSPVGDTERWADLSIDERRAIAAARIARWEAQQGAEARLALYLPKGPGANLLLAGLARQLALVGLDLVRAPDARSADLVLRDSVARFAGARWFLNQFNCAIAPRQCSPEADELVQLAVLARDGDIQTQLLATAEARLLQRNLYIPLGAPIRWSQVRSDVSGFAENPWAFHPLFPLSGAPI